MVAPREKPTAHRPLLQRKGAKRALVNVGGAVETVGDPELARRLAGALTLRPGERDATLTHPFHAYPARLHPEVARSLVAALAPDPGAVVLDPFCGSGTVLVEALVAGHRAVGRDLSPLAVELASLKTAITTADERRAIVAATKAAAARAEMLCNERVKLPVPPGEARWFAPHTLREVAALAAVIRDGRGLVRHALRMLLSSVLVKVSLQASDSDTRLVRKPIGPWEAIRLFAYKSRELDRCLAGLAEAVPRGASVDVAVDDATSLTTVPEGTVRAIVSSPPYANTYDYAAHHARRYAWLALDAERMIAGEMGAARWFDVPEAGALRFRRELGAMCAGFARVLAPGGKAAVVIADGAAGEDALRADKMLREAADGVGLAVVARASQDRKVFDADSLRAFLKRPKREHVVVLGKTDRESVMRQKELVELAMQTMNVSRDQAAKALDGVFSTLARALKEGDGKVPVEGVGTFRIKTTKARRLKNPLTGVEMDIPERKKVAFKASTEMAVALNGAPDDDEDEKEA